MSAETRHAILDAIGRRLRARRLELSLSAQDVASAAGMRLQKYRSMEAALEGMRIKVADVLAIAQVLQITPGQLVDGVPKQIGMKRTKYLAHPRAETVNIYLRILKQIARLNDQEVFDRILKEIESRPYGKVAAAEIRRNGVPTRISPVPKSDKLPVKMVDI